MPQTFTPPIAHTIPMGTGPLFGRMKIQVGACVVKTTSGAYRTENTHNPDRDDIAVVYDGGHVYTVDDAEAADLTAAGYGEYLGVA
jgi:hypothetical protein